MGLDRAAAKEAFAGFLTGRALTPRQIEFIDLIINELTEQGVMEPSRLYEQPFTGLSAEGPEAVLGDAGTDQVVGILEEIERQAAA